MPDSRPLRADAQRNRQAIIAAARTIFDSGEALRFDDFAGRAGVGVGTLYRHFETREALAAAVYRGEVSALIEQSRASTQPPGEVLEAFLRSFVEYVIAHPGLAQTLSVLVDTATQTEGGNQLEHAIGELMDQAAADGAIHRDASPGPVMVILHGISASSRRANWPSDSRAATELLIAALKVPDHPGP
ncbi:TetR/AcrR family transcriptional regulator [Kribbella sp. NPDC059898]|uniref:TetR/AcrR family transcriptional regulator n=1 Tax=Kribbella sp. NPDC059898 TaxID=3346995 RepID=UPI00366578B3